MRVQVPLPAPDVGAMHASPLPFWRCKTACLAGCPNPARIPCVRSRGRRVVASAESRFSTGPLEQRAVLFFPMVLYTRPMRCAECGQEVRSINFRHLKPCSGISPQEYRLRHPGLPLMDPDVRKSCGLPMERNPRWKGRTGRRCSGCGKTLHRKTRGARCQRCLERSGVANSFYGKQHSHETRQRMRLAQAARDKATYKGGCRDPAKASEARKKWWSNISEERKYELLKKFIEVGQRASKRSSKTEPETWVARVLDQMGVEYEQNKQIGRYNVDFLLEGVRHIGT